MDYNLTDKNRLFALFSTGKYANPIVGSLTPISTSTLPVPYTDGRGVIEYATLAQIHDSYVITPSLVNQFSVSLKPAVHSADEPHRRRQLSVEGRAHRPAARNRQLGDFRISVSAATTLP